MVATLEDVSAVLGRYLLAGWCMESACPNDTCPGCPLMSKGDITFCARCDGEPVDVNSGSLQLPMVVEQALPAGMNMALYEDSPPSPVSEAPSLPATQQDKPPDPLHQQRRAQSDAAAAEIGKRLLKGWTLLGEECPSESCYGIPLMTAPRAQPKEGDAASGKRGKRAPHDPRKWCVSCSRSYVDGRDAEKMARFEAASGESPAPAPAPASKAPAPLGEARAKRPSDGQADGRESSKRVAVASVSGPSTDSTATSTIASDARVEAQQALEAALRTLTAHLNLLTGSTPLNIAGISETAAAIGAAAHSLKVVS